MYKIIRVFLILVISLLSINIICTDHVDAKANLLSLHNIGAYEAANRMGASSRFTKHGYESRLGLESYTCKVGLIPEAKGKFPDTIIYADNSGYVKAITFAYLEKQKKQVYPKIKNCIIGLYGNIDKALEDSEQMKKYLATAMVNKKGAYYKSTAEDCYYFFTVKDDDGVISLTVTCTDTLR